MVEVLEMKFLFESTEGIWVKGYDDKSTHHVIFPEDLELMQFVGLKDKNGKEIFEGDIVRLVHRESETGGYFEDSNEKGIVYFDANWGVKFNCRDFTQRTAETHWRGEGYHWSDNAMKRDYHDIEVIGNIHQNPELLK